MPDIAGWEVCRRIKSELGGDKPVIVLHISATATGSDDFVRGLDGGADGYLAEPVRPELLLATVRSMLRAYRAEEALRERDAGLRRLVESNVVGIAIAGLDGVKDGNEEYLRITGAMPEDLRRGRLDWSCATAPEHLERDRNCIEELRSRGVCTPFEKELLRPDGNRVPVLVGASALSLNPLEWICFVVDLSVQKWTEAALTARTRELAESNENLQRFAYVVAHDMQTPLRNIGSLTQLLATRLEGSADSELRELMGLILSGVERGRSLIQDLLEYSQISGEARARIGPVDATVQADSAVASLRTAIEESKATVVIDPLPEVLADDQLSRVFQNLIENAIKYRGEADPYVHVNATRNGDYWQFAVSDNGMGFEMKYADTIFGVFRRLHGQEVEGSGIGLAVCRKLVERYGGRIWVESVPGSGSTFYFILRAVTTIRPRTKTAGDSRRGVANLPSRRPPAVLR